MILPGKRLTYPVFTDVCSALCHTDKLSRFLTIFLSLWTFVIVIRNLRFCPGGARVVGLSPVWWGVVNFEHGACVRELTEDSNLRLHVHIAYCVFVSWRALPVKCDKTETNSKYTYSLWTYEIYTLPFNIWWCLNFVFSWVIVTILVVVMKIHQILFFKSLKICI